MPFLHRRTIFGSCFKLLGRGCPCILSRSGSRFAAEVTLASMLDGCRTRCGLPLVKHITQGALFPSRCPGRGAGSTLRHARIVAWAGYATCQRLLSRYVCSCQEGGTFQGPSIWCYSPKPSCRRSSPLQAGKLCLQV